MYSQSELQVTPWASDWRSEWRAAGTPPRLFAAGQLHREESEVGCGTSP